MATGDPHRLAELIMKSKARPTDNSTDMTHVSVGSPRTLRQLTMNVLWLFELVPFGLSLFSFFMTRL
jgi:hypothetical protein